jgi:hypothetical protein
MRKVFSTNFWRAIKRAGTRHDLTQCKQRKNKSLHTYTRRFFETHATIANISDQDIIDWFQHCLADGYLYRDFGR